MCDGSNAQEERRGTEHKQKRSASRSRTVRTAQGTVRASKDGRSPNGRGDSSSRDGEGDVRGSVDWSIDERYQCSAIVLRKGEGRKVGATPRTEAGRAVRGGRRVEGRRGRAEQAGASSSGQDWRGRWRGGREECDVAAEAVVGGGGFGGGETAGRSACGQTGVSARGSREGGGAGVRLGG